MNSSIPLSYLFNNAAFLLSRDLKTYKIHETEVEFYDQLIQFLRDLTANINSLSKTGKLTNDNIITFNSIPVMVQTLEKSKESFKNIQGKNKVDYEFFNILANFLEDYKKKKEMEPELKKILKLFFERLARQYEPRRNFEKTESLEFENA
jgi:hypothetical protein